MTDYGLETYIRAGKICMQKQKLQKKKQLINIRVEHQQEIRIAS